MQDELRLATRIPYLVSRIPHLSILTVILHNPIISNYPGTAKRALLI